MAKSTNTDQPLTEIECRVLRNADENQNRIHCACNNKPCAGLCRDTNLLRKRINNNPCPAAFIPAPKRRERRDRHYREDD